MVLMGLQQQRKSVDRDLWECSSREEAKARILPDSRCQSFII